jgi:hypothetical protein
LQIVPKPLFKSEICNLKSAIPRRPRFFLGDAEEELGALFVSSLEEQRNYAHRVDSGKEESGPILVGEHVRLC